MEGSMPKLGDFVFLSRRAEDELPLIGDFECPEPELPDLIPADTA